MTVRQLVILGPTDPVQGAKIVRALAILAASDGPVVLLDADVVGGHLADGLGAPGAEPRPFSGRKVAVIVQQRCTGCGACLQYCRLRAISATLSGYQVDASRCEGCHSCYYQCPSRAVDMLEEETGVWFASQCAVGMLFRGKMGSARAGTGRLLNALRLEARSSARTGGQATVLVAAPYGMPEVVQEALVGADLLLLAMATQQDLTEAETALDQTRTARIPRIVLAHPTATSSASLQRARTRLDPLRISIVLDEPCRPAVGCAPGHASARVWSSLAGPWGQIHRQLWHS